MGGEDLVDGGECVVEDAEVEGGALDGGKVLPGSIDAMQVFVLEMLF